MNKSGQRFSIWATMILLCATTLNVIVPARSTHAKPRYVPPKTIGAPDRTMGGGSRGCEGQIAANFRLLVPRDHIGVTLSGRPTLAWHMDSVPPVPMQLALVEPGVSKPLWVTMLTDSQKGLNQIQVPETVPELQSGHRYRWTLTQICNRKRPSVNAYATAWIDRVNTNTKSQKTGGHSLSKDKQVNQFTEAGIWYDGLALLTKDYPRSPERSTSINELLKQVGIDQLKF